ncbi:MAG: GTPase Era [Bacteroidetes bacterium]|nr:GTPase Era [Bacteroidota bacterium]
MSTTKHKAGFVNIIGNPNAGKSTLMNALVGEKLSIITPKAQTTRHRIMGIVNSDDFQIVYSDTPGILKPNYKLQENMMGFVKSSLSDADVFLLMIDVTDREPFNEEILMNVKNSGIAKLVLLNKCDLIKQDKMLELVAEWRRKMPNTEVLPIAALHKLNVHLVIDKVVKLLPECPPYFDKEELTDKTQRFFVSEIIREKIFFNYHKEIPYSAEVLIDEFKEEERITKIRATIIVERDTQKGIIIGHKGESIKKVGIESRKDIENFLDARVFLELFVKVDKDWRNNENRLKQFGYKAS